MTERAMRIAIIGGGAMGSIYASLLARSPHEIWLVDIWREHVAAIRVIVGSAGALIVNSLAGPIRGGTDGAAAARSAECIEI